MAEIGRSSFSLDPRPVVGGQGAAAPAQVQVGIQGNGVQDTSRIPEYRADHSAETNIDVLTKLGGQLLAPAIKREQQARFDEGMRRAAAGEAAADIEAERPAWATFFGEGDVTLGARTYEGAADAANVEAEIVRQMPELRKLPAEQFQQSIRGIIDTKKTGDATRDAAMEKSYLTFMPQALKTHAKENWAWQQQEAVTQDLKYLGSTFDAFEAQDAASRESAIGKQPVYPDSMSDRRKPTYSEADQQAAKSRLMGALVPAPGQNQETRDNSVALSLFAQMSSGKMAAATALRQTVDPVTGRSLWDMLPAQHLDRLNQMYQSMGKVEQTKRLTSAEMDTIMALSQTDRVEDLDVGIDRLNASVKARTGIDVDQLDNSFALQQRARMIREKEAAEKEGASKARVAADRVSKLEQAAAEDRTQVARGVSFLTNPDPAATGGLKALQDLRLVDPKNADQAEYDAWNSKPVLNPATGKVMSTGEFRAMVAVRNMDPLKPLVKLVGQAFASPVAGAAVMEMVAVMEHLPESKWMSHGMNEVQAVQTANFLALKRLGIPAAEAWDTAGQQAIYSPKRNPIKNDDDIAALDDEQKNVQRSEATWFWQADKLNASGAATLRLIANHEYAKGNGTWDKKTAAKNAFELANSKMEIAGSSGWFKAKSDDPPAWSLVSETGDPKNHPATAAHFSAAFTQALEKKVKALGIEVPTSDLVITRAPTTKGRPLFFTAIVYGPEGTIGKGMALTLDDKEIQAELIAAFKKQQDEAKKSFTDKVSDALPPAIRMY